MKLWPARIELDGSLAWPAKIGLALSVGMMGGVGIHHFCTIGDYAYISGYARIHHDVPPFVKVDGEDRIRALNTIGLKRAGFSDEDIQALMSDEAVTPAREHYALLSPRAEQQSTFATVKARMEAAEVAATLPPASVEPVPTDNPAP